MSGAGGAFLRLSQSASALMLRNDLLLGDDDVLAPLEDDSDLDELEEVGMAVFASVVRRTPPEPEACGNSGVSSGEKWLVAGRGSCSREESRALPLESCSSDDDDLSKREM